MRTVAAGRCGWCIGAGSGSVRTMSEKTVNADSARKKPSKAKPGRKDPDAVESGNARAHRVPDRTTPTWEIELLVSGVTVFALLQLPSALDNAYFGLENRLDRSWATALMLGYFYLKASVVILASTFVAHMVMRAYWVSLVGLDSVYPDGIRWKQLRLGKIKRATEEELSAPLPDRISAADDRSSLIFAIGVSLAGLLLVLTIFVAAALAISLPLARVEMLAPYQALLVPVIFVLLLLPWVIAWLLDLWIGDRLDPRRGPGRWLRWLFRAAYRLGLGQASNPTLALVGSHEGDTRVRIMVRLAIVLVLLGIIWAHHIDREDRSAGSFQYVPTDSPGAARTLRAGHYDSLRDVDADTPLPYISSEFADGDWLRLAVPYRPNLHNATLERVCPKGAVEEPKGALARDRRRIELLRCYARIHAVTLDGVPVRELAYDFATDPKTSLPVVVAMIDIRHLAPGRHELGVRRPRVESDDDPRDYRIPIWR